MEKKQKLKKRGIVKLCDDHGSFIAVVCECFDGKKWEELFENQKNIVRLNNAIEDYVKTRK